MQGHNIFSKFNLLLDLMLGQTRGKMGSIIQILKKPLIYKEFIEIIGRNTYFKFFFTN